MLPICGDKHDCQSRQLTSRTQCKHIRHNIKSSIAKASDYLCNPLFDQTFLAFDDWYLAVFMILYSLSNLL